MHLVNGEMSDVPLSAIIIMRGLGAVFFEDPSNTHYILPSVLIPTGHCFIGVQNTYCRC